MTDLQEPSSSDDVLSAAILEEGQGVRKDA